DLGLRAGREGTIPVERQVPAEPGGEGGPEGRAARDLAFRALPRDRPAARLDADVVRALPRQEDFPARGDRQEVPARLEQDRGLGDGGSSDGAVEIGRASCRERV